MMMIERITSRPCAERGPGHAVLTIAGTGLPEVADVTVILRQGSGASQKTLGAHGWQPSEARLTPLEARAVAGGLDIVVGPDVVQHLRPGNYGLSLAAGGEPGQAKGFSWTVPPFRPSRTPVTAAPPDPPPPPPPPPPSSPDEPEAEAAPPETADPAETLRSDPRPAPTPPAGRIPMIPVAAGLALLVAAAVLWAVWSGDGEAVPAPGTAPTASSAPPPAADPEALARRMVAENATPQAMGEQGRRLLEDGQPGAALLLLRRAGDGGDVQSLLALARLFDPSPGGRPVAGGPDPSGVMALTLYQRADTLSPGIGRPGRDALVDWARTRDAAGDPLGAVILRAAENLDN